MDIDSTNVFNFDIFNSCLFDITSQITFIIRQNNVYIQKHECISYTALRSVLQNLSVCTFKFDRCFNYTQTTMNNDQLIFFYGILLINNNHYPFISTILLHHNKIANFFIEIILM